MTCYAPVQGWYSKERNLSGKRSFTASRNNALIDRPMTVPCGQCIGCRLERSKMWATRCVFESEMHDENCFITLTYDDQHLPSDGSVNLKHFQLFMKRLRKKMVSYINRGKAYANKYPYGHKIGYFMCAEYGELCGYSNIALDICKSLTLQKKIPVHKHQPVIGRPHYHACLFNCAFDDLEHYSTRNGVKLYQSETLKKLWSNKNGESLGYVTVGDVNFESAAYVARYCLKKEQQQLYGIRKENYYENKRTEFVTMSRRPGIASNWFDEFASDVYSDDVIVIRDNIKCKPPKYFDTKYELLNPDEMRKIKSLRKLKAKDNPRNTPEKLAVRERVQNKKLKSKVRSYETQGV